ncbi:MULTISPECIES: hypothetical protein [Bacillus]|uniref:Uncharacterized protein n=1 Tax=Bacillus pseudomycoides TaxID=64104 RepID=A0A1Y3MCR8_9BACI|nr:MULTISPECIES: hypothetical protein [Bacillus cereus group]EOP53193.1 hypothetical protein IIW_01729 [Bacillus cereus VD136]EOP72518.1 hypothetical protein KOW_01086 [Bacillus cereus VDM006]EOQ07176.1 hypothetical protein KOY_03400 [Bacillus cereus VDM021]OOG94386.1 hypothetical protein BTH41_02085 [Bacillus mycoides]MDF2085792.1 hypothetical protein [Bacillus pseudomycoides]
MIWRTHNKKARKTVRYVAGLALLLILASYIYQWNNNLVIDTNEDIGLILVLTTFLSSFLPVKKQINE